MIVIILSILSGLTIISFVADMNVPVVYTDGACSNNGRRNAQAGIGVWWGPNDPRYTILTQFIYN